MLALLTALSIFPFRPGGFSCQFKTTATYYAYNQCFLDDVQIGSRWDGYAILLTCARVTVVCPKTDATQRS